MDVGTILIIAMSETQKNKYHIVGYLEEHCEFVSFTTEKYFSDGKPLLDIGSYSKAMFKDNGNNEISLGKDINLIRSLPKSDLMNFLEEKKSNFSIFLRHNNMKFAIVEVKFIEELIIKRNKGYVDTYLIAIMNGNRKRIKIKDFRWVNYWNKVSGELNENQLNERIEFYKDFFNSRKTYLLLHRYKNEVKDIGRYKKTEDIYWASGIFYS